MCTCVKCECVHVFASECVRHLFMQMCTYCAMFCVHFPCAVVVRCCRYANVSVVVEVDGVPSVSSPNVVLETDPPTGEASALSIVSVRFNCAGAVVHSAVGLCCMCGVACVVDAMCM